jgi:hypothetical protein
MAQIIRKQCLAITIRKKEQCKNLKAKGNKKYCALHSNSTKKKLEKQSVSYNDAIKRFHKLPMRTQQLDMSKTSKNTYNNPNKYWLKYPNKSDVRAIDDQFSWNVVETITISLKTWIKDLNKSDDFPVDLQQQLMKNFEQVKITDARKIIKKIKNKLFLIYLMKHSNKRTHPHLIKASSEQLMKLQK